MTSSRFLPAAIDAPKAKRTAPGQSASLVTPPVRARERAARLQTTSQPPWRLWPTDFEGSYCVRDPRSQHPSETMPQE